MRLFRSQVIGDIMIRCHENQRMTASIVTPIKKSERVGEVYREKNDLNVDVTIMTISMKIVQYIFVNLISLRAKSQIARITQFSPEFF